jgi:hypothetical protein
MTWERLALVKTSGMKALHRFAAAKANSTKQRSDVSTSRWFPRSRSARNRSHVFSA